MSSTDPRKERARAGRRSWRFALPSLVILASCRPEPREAEDGHALRAALERSVIAVDVGSVDPAVERDLAGLSESSTLSPKERDDATFALVRLHEAGGRRDAALALLESRDAKPGREPKGDAISKRLRSHLLAGEPLEDAPPSAPVIVDELVRMPLGIPGVTATLDGTTWNVEIARDVDPAPVWRIRPSLFGNRPVLVEHRRTHDRLSMAFDGARPVKSTGSFGLIEYPGHLGVGRTSTLVFDGGSLRTYVRLASPPEAPELRFVLGLPPGATLRRIGAFVEVVSTGGVARFRWVASELLDSTGEGVPTEPVVEGCRPSTPAELRELDQSPETAARVRCTVLVRWRTDVHYPALFSAVLQSTERLTGGDVSYESFLVPLSEGKALAIARGNVAQVFDSTSRTWSIVEPPPFVFRHRDRLVSLGDGRAWAVSPQERCAAIFSAKTERWSPVRPLGLDGAIGKGRGLALLPRRDGRVLAFTDTQSTFEVDPASGAWTTRAPSPLVGATNLQAAELADGSIVVGGGFAPRVARYFPSTNVWSSNDTEVSNNGSDLVPLSNGKALIVDVGRGAREWDIEGSTVRQVPSPLLPSLYHSPVAGHLSSGKVHYLAGGNFVYDEALGEIVGLGPFPSGAKVHNAVVLLSNGQALAIGGGQETRADLFRVEAKPRSASGPVTKR
jgi:hypothetical protein